MQTLSHSVSEVHLRGPQVLHDENDRVWIMLHSGSRNIGNQTAQHYDSKAKVHLSLLDIRVVPCFKFYPQFIFDHLIESLPTDVTQGFVGHRPVHELRSRVKTVSSLSILSVALLLKLLN